MKQWIANLFKDPKSKDPVAVFERYGLRARVTEQPRACGHVGHLVELDLFVPSKDEWLPVGLVSDTTLQDAILLLQEAQEFVGGLSGVRLLPTVRLNDKAYFLDARLSEFRAVDNPYDRRKIVEVM
jgi:hypothetical protein